MMEQIVVPPTESFGEMHAVKDGSYNPMLTERELIDRAVRLRKTDNPKVSVIFVARNESEWLSKAVDSLFATKNETPYECIVYDDNSTDYCCNDIEVHKLLCSRQVAIGPSRARNWGAMVAQGEILIFCDGHLKFNDGWIDDLIAPILEGKCDVVNPIISDITITSTKGYGWDFDTTSYEYKWGNSCNEFEYRAGMAGGCFAIKKSVFMYVGMFDKGFTKWGMEDSELALRLSLSGFTIGIEPKVDVGHFFKQTNEYGVDWFSYNYNFLRMAYVNMDEEGVQHVFSRVPGDDKEKARLLEVVKSTSKFRRVQASLIRKVSFADYKAQYGKKMS